jgi:hypothetical protein
MNTIDRHLIAFRTRAWKIAGALIFSLGLMAFLGLATPVYAMPIHGSFVLDPGDPQNDKCKPHPGNGINPHCPPPVVPEAPMAVLLPLSVAALLGVGYVSLRKRPHTTSA